METLDTEFVLKRAAAKKLEHIRTLNCWGLNLENVQVIRQLENIEVLNLSSNRISTLEDIKYCTKLRELYIRKNRIGSFTELEHLKNLPNLTVLWLTENPLVSSHNYRLQVLQMLPHLRKLDNKVVTEEERRLAKAAQDEKRSSSNIMSAILYLLNELNKEELVTLRDTIDKQIQE